MKNLQGGRRHHGGSITAYQPRVLEHMIAALAELSPFPAPSISEQARDGMHAI